MTRIIHVFAILLLSLDARADLSPAIRDLVESRSEVQIGQLNLPTTSLRNLYSIRGYRPLFVSEQGLAAAGTALTRALVDDAPRRGLKTGFYLNPETQGRFRSTDMQSLVELEILLAQAYLDYARDLASGRIVPTDSSQGLDGINLGKIPFGRPEDYKYLSDIARQSEWLRPGLLKLEPQNDGYQRLVQLLGRMRDLRSEGGWPAFKGFPLLKYDPVNPVSHENVPAIRSRLVDWGMMPDDASARESLVYDENIKRGIERLQHFARVKVDGAVGKDTYPILNVAFEKRRQQVIANLERWRLLPRALGDKYLLVDLGRQELDVIEGGRRALWMEVVVGRGERRTPTMIDNVTGIVVNPYWVAPHSIAVKDIIPEILRDPSYLLRNRMRICSDRACSRSLPYERVNEVDWARYTVDNPPPFMFRQEAGEQNSLGVLKFNLTNGDAIYLHDTNHKELFNRSVRVFSSGCIRLANPKGLASYLLHRDQGLTGPFESMLPELENMIATPQLADHKVPLKKRVRTYIVGFTVSVEENGTVRFNWDPYGEDEKILSAMNQIVLGEVRQ